MTLEQLVADLAAERARAIVAPLEQRVQALEAKLEKAAAEDETAISKKEAAAMLGIGIRELDRRMQKPSQGFADTYFRSGRRVKFIRRKLIAWRGTQA